MRVTRATAWITLWDDMLEGGAAPEQIVDLALRALPQEREEQNVQRILSYLGKAYWTFLDRRRIARRWRRASSRRCATASSGAAARR